MYLKYLQTFIHVSQLQVKVYFRLTVVKSRLQGTIKGDILTNEGDHVLF